MSSHYTISSPFIPGLIFGPDGTMTFTGRETANGMPGARMTVDTRCRDCGQPFKAGEQVNADLALDWDAAEWRHETCPASQ